MEIKIGWGSRILILYLSFVLLIIALVAGSMRQHFDLVSDDYYAQELDYQNTINAANNQIELTGDVHITADHEIVTIVFPPEFKNKTVKATLHFYCPSGTLSDRKFQTITDNGIVNFPRAEFKHVFFKLKIGWESEGKKYYQETDLNLVK